MGSAVDELCDDFQFLFDDLISQGVTLPSPSWSAASKCGFEAAMSSVLVTAPFLVASIGVKRAACKPHLRLTVLVKAELLPHAD